VTFGENFFHPLLFASLACGFNILHVAPQITLHHEKHRIIHILASQKSFNMDKEAAAAKQQWIDTLRSEMPLARPDKTTPSHGYIPLIFGFSAPFGESDIRQCLTIELRSRFRACLAEWPFLTGQYIHADDRVAARLVYHPDNPIRHSGLTFFPDEVFDSWVHEVQVKLESDTTPPSTMKMDLYCLVPHKAPGPGDSCHPVTLQVNFLDDGLILGFAFHDGVFDHNLICSFLKFFGNPRPVALNASNTVLDAKMGFTKLERE
jgi:hypothetical protein